MYCRRTTKSSVKKIKKAMNKIFLTSLLVLIAFVHVQGQQAPHYTQYMYNMNVMNPAYAGSKENISIGLLHRRQWVNIDDAPTTSTFSIHSPTGKNVGMGLLMFYILGSLAIASILYAELSKVFSK